MNLANDSQFAKSLPNQNLPLKYFECSDFARQKFGKHTFVKIPHLQYFTTYGIYQQLRMYRTAVKTNSVWNLSIWALENEETLIIAQTVSSQASLFTTT